MGRKSLRPDKSILVELLKTRTSKQIAELYEVTPVTISRWKSEYGLSKTVSGPKRWQTNREFFSSIDTPEKAYILGFVIADGHVDSKGRVDISVKEEDRYHLQRMSDIVGCDAPLKTSYNSYDRSPRARIAWCGKRLVEDLNALGVQHDKSYTAVYPCIREDLEQHLIRGIWDGDGYIGKYQFDLIGTPATLDGVSDAVYRHTGCSLRRSMRGKDRSYHYLHGTRRDTEALHWMYSNSDLCLERKRTSFLLYWPKNPRT